MSYTSKYTGNEIDELLDKVKISSEGNTLITNSPVGSIISYIGMNAPQDYLVCDGRELNINEYKELADHFKKEFGTVNHYGGDGETTFAIPDLRNEFLRGYYADSEEQLSEEVGIHQDATEHIAIATWNASTTSGRGVINLRSTQSQVYSTVTNADIELPPAKENNRTTIEYSANIQAGTVEPNFSAYTSRPTNVAVLFCIKYKNSVSTIIPITPVQELETVLWEGESGAKSKTNVTDTITLSESVTNFDTLRFHINHVYNDTAIRYGYEEIPVEEYIKYLETPDNKDRIVFLLGYLSSTCFWEIQKSSTDTTITSVSTISYITKVVGVKYSASIVTDTEEFATTEYVDSLVGDIENVLKEM